MAEHEPRGRLSEFRFYEELNDFLPAHRRKVAFGYEFFGTPSVKDAIEAVGVPHTEVDLILVNGRSVGFDHLLSGGERVAVYPTFERLDILPLSRLRPEPLRESRFVADVHLGKLARYLRLLGFDTRYDNDLDDPTIAEIGRSEKRIVLTRDRGLLKRNAVTHGYWVRSRRPREQLVEVVRSIDLGRRLRPFSRCLSCNGSLADAPKESIQALVPEGVLSSFDRFLKCEHCQQVYWAGSHYRRLEAIVEHVRQGAEGK